MRACPYPHRQQGDPRRQREQQPAEMPPDELLAVLGVGVVVAPLVVRQLIIFHRPGEIALVVQRLAEARIRQLVVGGHPVDPQPHLFRLFVQPPVVQGNRLPDGSAQRRGSENGHIPLFAVQHQHPIPQALHTNRPAEGTRLLSHIAEHAQQIAVVVVLEHPPPLPVERVQESVVIRLDIDKAGVGLLPPLVADLQIAVVTHVQLDAGHHVLRRPHPQVVASPWDAAS